jgi:HD-GYP domain-containing protein (c-di-GMP phosphodiesterase class II)
MAARMLERFRGYLIQPLYVHIVLILILLTATLGGGQIWFNYQKNTELIEESLAILYDKTAQQVYRNLKTNYDTAANNVEIMAEGWLVDAQNLEQRLRYLPILSKALNVNDVVSGYSVGYENGDFFMVRSALDESVREKLKAPPNTSYIVDNISADLDQKRVRLVIYFDNNLQEISRKHVIDEVYDPRKRSWYQRAIESDKSVTTAPYVFFFLQSPGTSIAIASKRSPGNVIAADITLNDLSQELTENRITPSSELLLLNDSGTVLAYQDPEQLILKRMGEFSDIAKVADLKSGVLQSQLENIEPVEKGLRFVYADEQWGGAITKFEVSDDFKLYMLLVAPDKELFPRALEIRHQLSIITIILILLSLPVIFFSAYKISQPLRKLAIQTRQIRRFDFSAQSSTHSPISELSTLANDMEAMKHTISHFLNMLNSLAGEQDLDSLIATITRQTLAINAADAAVLYMVNNDSNLIEPACVMLANDEEAQVELPSYHIDQGDSFIVQGVNRKGAKLHGLRCNKDEEKEFSPLYRLLGTDILEVLTLPLNNRAGETTGVLCVINKGENSTNDHAENLEHIAFMQSLSGFAAVSIESKHSLKSQQNLLASFIKLIAGAIDAKSHHTAGHCSRVPEIAKLLAEQVCLQDKGEFKDFSLSEAQFEELETASWLHDCGKITTPEYVVDKATKLETLYDRIHEVRMRFEVLKRDAQIRYLQALNEGGDDSKLSVKLNEELSQIDSDFDFIAQCNIGRESMSENHLQRVHEISKITWQRTLDDSIGISFDEITRKRKRDFETLPVTENLLNDRVDHLIEWHKDGMMIDQSKWGFKMPAPKYKYNRGELYNLSISKGTLNSEERFMINDHIIQTITMLDALKFPNNLSNVLEIAGAHHEKVDGTGYPRQLRREQMSECARMLAIADIFEALTARDRPYKRAKTLSEALDIMHKMKLDQHIDGPLFDIFLSSGVFRMYADKYLSAQQMDEVDITLYLDS